MEKYLLFNIGENIHGIKISDTGQIYEAKRLTPIPLSERKIAGMVDVGGVIKTVIDLGECLYSQKIDLSLPEEKRMVSIHNTDKCFLFDSANEIIEICEKDIQPLTIENSTFSIGKYKNTVFSIISKEEILEKIVNI